MAAQNAITFSQKNLFSCTFSAFYDMKKTGVLSDVTIKIGNRVFSAHRVILAAVIPYFRTMFTSNLAESKQNEISMEGLDSDALENIIDFAYTNQIEITTENVQSLLVASEFLQLIQVRDSCCDFLSKTLDPNNVMHVRSLAGSLNCLNLVENCDCYIRQHFDDFCLTKDFINLPFPFLNELIGRDDLHVRSEDKVFEAIMAWVKTDQNRHCVLPELLTGVRMTYLTPQFLIKKVSRERLILESFLCRDLLDEAKHFHLLAEERPSSCSFSLKERCYNSRAGSMYLFYCNHLKGLTVLQYDSMTGKWNTILNDETRSDVQHVIALGDEIYVFRRNKIFEKLNPLTLQWSPRKKLPGTAPVAEYAVAFSDVIYCFTNTPNLSSAVYFDPKQNEWFHYQQLIEFSCAEMISCGAGIYILGSRGNRVNLLHGPLRINKIHNPRTKTSTDIVQMSSPNRIRFGCAVLDDQVYVCGGFSERSNGHEYVQWGPRLSSSEVYNASNQSWKSISPMNTERSNFSLVSYNKKLYAFGGKGRNQSNINSIECYDPVTDKWTPAGSFGSEYSFLKAVVIPSQNQ